MDYLPEDFVIRQLRVEYKKQAFLNDALTPYVVESEDGIVVALRDEDGAAYAVAEFKEV